ncbi:lipoxygenase family protein [Nodularia spumigena]|uniref:lipoxygenase family protein n=1 Tax=Nodularia spumigena TaxID=70799 RepID=UPI00232D8A24|nr:lipoxygenase family protein [Nodularia spumigena]MDB9316333.1 lipoxygenase family protein [Nodularia spumigena CS-590/01A]MDB9325563.1 lipoxygenase family protein [Nodularia spumigena CS-590/02]MDB9336742.1 lipoxygenase family protein [Nodularia spumigena CS-590/01]MDB9361175.1 lipoxygenase family protein [Nodularia spumigena CS-588/02]MDB9366797.1 lipoxygenase family protein [Nodularia spumigena CS-588/02A10]
MTTSSPDNSRSLPITQNLELARQEYQYNYTHIPPIPMVNQLPNQENFTTRWTFLLAQQLREIFINTLITNRGDRSSKSVRDQVKRFILEALFKGAIPAKVSVIARLLQIIPQFLIQGISKDFHELDDLFFSLFKTNGLLIFRDSLNRITALLDKGHPTGHVNSLKDYQKLFTTIELPAIAKTFDQDQVFAYMQVAGYNPLVIKRVNSPGANFPVEETHYQAVMGNDDSLAAAGQEGRLYLADYQILDGAINGTYLNYQKYAYAPLALFAIPKNSDPNRLLRPIAIQCGQTPGADYPIITPNSGKYAWLFAKTIVHIADGNFHEAVSHLARTHLFVGVFVIATHRQLSPSHPLSLLLRPHFEGTLAINNAAQEVLIAPGGGVDRLLSSTIDNSRILAVRGLQSYSFNEAMLPNQLKQRGVDDPELLPVYPYRDDALLIWNAIHQWVSDYLSLYYPTDKDIQNDTALQAWAAEAKAENGGRVPDFGENGGIQTLDYLVDAATLIIFTASAQHAAVNFPQKDLMSYAPAFPLAGYVSASIKGEVSEQDYLNLLPPLEQAQQQFNLLTLLGSIYYNQLGEYPKSHFANPKVQTLLQKFQSQLQQIEITINQRNLHRPTYEYLLPSKIPQSINI